jgi:signal peptidase I
MKIVSFIKSQKKFILSILLIVIISIFVRIFLFEIMRVPSPSMENTILTGDFILMGKYQYGTRFFSKNSVFRSPSFSSIKRSDVIVFNYPIGDTILEKYPDENYYEFRQKYKRNNIISNTDGYGKMIHRNIWEKTQYVKRCIAIPGDTVSIIKNVVYVNNHNTNEPLTYIPSILVYVPNKGDIGWQLKKKIIERDYAEMYPNDFSQPWSQSYYGPLYVPKKGANLKINNHNISLYRRVIETYENNRLELRDTSIFLNNKLISNYTFKKDYYFVLGDNRDNSKDSRFWGFVPEDHIKGKVMMVLFSMNNSTFRWNRLFKSIK